MALSTVYQAASWFLRLLSDAIFVYVLLTWIMPRCGLCYWLGRFVEPFCAPFRPLARRACLRWGARFDLTYWFAIIGLRLFNYLLRHVFILLMRLL